MMDKILDFLYDCKDKLQDFWWWSKDHLKEIGITFLILFSVVVFSLGMLKKDRTEADKIGYNNPEYLAYLEEKSEMVQKMFLNLDEDTDYQLFGASSKSYIDTDNTAILIYNFYVRKPFTDTNTIESNLDSFLELVKAQAKSQGITVRSLKVNLYYRKALYDENLDPSGTYKYMLDYAKLDTKKLQDLPEYANQSVEGIADGETMKTKRINYKNYRTYFDYLELKRDNNVVGLTDEEFESFLKFDKYVALAQGFDAGVKLYMRWELGANVTEKSYLNIVSQFKNFQSRLKDINEPYEYFSVNNNFVVLQDRLLINNPQLLLFTVSNKVVTNPSEARKELLAIYPDDYEFTLVAFAEKQGELYVENGKIYEPAGVDLLNNMTNSQKIANGFVDKEGNPLPNIDYDKFYSGEIDKKGKEIKK